MPDKNVYLAELTRLELNRAIDSGQIRGALVPTGAIEQHQDHLAMVHDTASITEIARRSALRFYPHVLVAPTVSMSVSEHHMARGGALTIRAEVFLDYVYDICHSLKRLGVPKVMVVNGHGGNKRKNLEAKCPEHFVRLDELGVEYITYWETCPAAFYQAHLELESSAGHAGEFETSFAMALFPERIRADQVNYDNAKRASIAKGGHIIEAVLEGVCGQVGRMLNGV